MLIDKSLRELLDAFGSADPTPGGGSASALASAVGTSLLMMVAALPRTRSNSADDRAALSRAHAELTLLRRGFADAIDADTAAYDQVVGAYKLPKQSPDEQQARKAAIQHAMRSAIDVPLGVMRLSHLALRQAATVALHGNRSAASDVGVALALLQTGAAGARLNVEINLRSVGDAAYAEGVRAEVARLADDIPNAAAEVNRLLSQE
jgi:formiminotetrahydrofolate cyclodeaminase